MSSSARDFVTMAKGTLFWKRQYGSNHYRYGLEIDCVLTDHSYLRTPMTKRKNTA